MSDDYFKTADRMQRDSRVLHDNKCWHNACYLAGYVVEAGLKAIIRADNERKGKRNPKPPHTHDIEELVRLVTRTRLIGSRRRPFDSARITRSELFKKWDPYRRYQPTRWNDENLSADFQKTAKYMMKLLNKLKSDGVIR